MGTIPFQKKKQKSNNQVLFSIEKNSVDISRISSLSIKNFPDSHENIFVLVEHPQFPW